MQLHPAVICSRDFSETDSGSTVVVDTPGRDTPPPDPDPIMMCLNHHHRASSAGGGAAAAGGAGTGASSAQRLSAAVASSSRFWQSYDQFMESGGMASVLGQNPVANSDSSRSVGFF